MSIDRDVARWEDQQQSTATPGPWVVERDGWRYQRIYGADTRVPGNSRFIAEVSLDYDGAEANALMIAASPDLLAACEKALEWAKANKQRAGSLDVDALQAAILLALEGRRKVTPPATQHPTSKEGA